LHRLVVRAQRPVRNVREFGYAPPGHDDRARIVVGLHFDLPLATLMWMAGAVLQRLEDPDAIHRFFYRPSPFRPTWHQALAYQCVH
jgi:hypothetical protein